MIESASEYRPGQFASGAITALADVTTVDVRGFGVMAMTLENSAAALTGFVVQFRAAPPTGVGSTPPFVSIASVTGDYTTPFGPIIDASGDLTVLGVGSGYLILDVRGMESIKFRASCATSTALILTWGLSPA